MAIHRNTERQTDRNAIKLCTINICGMSTRSQFSLNKFLDTQQIDILCTQETNTTDPEKLRLNNMGYITDTNNAKNRGAALYAKDIYSITKLEEISKISKHIDSCWGLVTIHNQRYIIGSVYNKLDYKLAIKEIMKMLTAAEKRKVELKAQGIILSGDYNARHLSWGDTINNEYGKQLVGSLDHTKYSISISQSPTFLCTNGASYIDFSIISNNIVDSVSSCKTDESVELFSGAPTRGHLPLITEFQIRNQANSGQYSEKLDLSKMKWDSWSHSIETDIKENKENIEAEDNPFTLWNKLNAIITKATDNHGEKKKCTQYSKPYWTSSLSISSRKLQAARKSYIKRNTDDNLRKLNEAREEFDTERKTACQDFLINKAKQLNSAQAQHFWKEFNKIFNKKTVQKIDPLDNGKNGLLTDPKDVESCLFSVFFEAKHLVNGDFDDAFYNEVNKLHEEIIKENDEEHQEYNNEEIHNLNRDVTVEEIMKAIKYTGKSVDNCNFHPTMFKHLGNEAKNVLKKLFNLCLATNRWVWEAAEVIFLRKAGKDSYAKPGSYRPICITAYIGKLLEAIIARRLEALLLKTNQVDPDQEGFSKQKNTIRYLNRLHLGIKVNKENYLTVLCLFIDFEKAFDSIWKKGMIMKLSNLGIEGNVLKLINNFLFTRTVALNINGKVGSSRQCAEYGLPQGSVLSPVLFKLYVSDFVAELNNRQDIVIYKFADDGTIKITAEDSQTCIATLQQVLISLQNWTKKWRMKLNCDKNKTEVIAFNTAERNKDLIPTQFSLGDKVIYRVSKTKVLGLTIDEDLTYEPHSAEVLKSLHAVWSTLCKYSSRHWGFTQKVMLQLVKSLFISKMSYASHIWMSNENTKEIMKLWYHVMKSIIGSVLNISQNVAEVILGVPPILIQANINSIKHFLKLNILPVQNDRYAQFIANTYNDPNVVTSAIHSKFKVLFKFLQWKLRHYELHFTAEESTIIRNSLYGEFFNLSRKSCSYTQQMMNRYVESELWISALKTQFQLDGYHDSPNPSCDPLPIPRNTTRETEVLLMGLMYKNNLSNSSLYKIGRVPSPLCTLCESEEDTADHILFRCREVDQELRSSAATSYMLANNIRERQGTETDHIGLLKCSRDKAFILSCVQIINSIKPRLRLSVEL